VIALLLALQLQQAAAQSPAVAATPQPAPVSTTQRSVDGAGKPTATIPLIDAAIAIDGNLDEPAWEQAVRLTGFSQYRPVDSRPAEERTEVLVWYSPSAIYFGIVAHDREPGSIRATVADRDRLERDDTVTIYLDTFNDRRRAFFFQVNPLGIQADGVQTEGAFNPGTMFGGSTDYNPDYQFDSKGRLTENGYVVEIRIPFKSLRYPGTGPQRWGINVLRKVQRTGYEDTWTDVHRASSSFLAQAGAIDGLHNLKRGVVTEIQPFVTATSNGALETATGRFARDSIGYGPGVNLRVGLTNVSIDTTLNPDFSQVESDAGQVTLNERFALFYPEKRPFFLEGIELFSTPNQLVYTRQVADPIAGGKVTGKVGRYGIAYLAARDDLSPDDATFNIMRLRRDIGAAGSLAGVTFTDRTTAAGYNRVVAADTRLLFKKLYYVQFQLGQAWTGDGDLVQSAPVWTAEFDRTGRAWGFNYKINGVGPGFITRSGYVPRSDVVEFHASNRFTWYGKRGAAMENFTVFFGPTLLWPYAGFSAGDPIEGASEVTLMTQLRGGWTVHGNVSRAFVRFDQDAYAAYAAVRGPGLVVPYVPLDEVSGAVSGSITATTPTFRLLNASVALERGEVAIFPEASEGLETVVTTGVSLRPTSTIRVDVTNTYSRITRQRDGSEFGRTVIPRIKVEYQPTRALFFRVVGEYRSERQAMLRDWQTGDPLIVGGVPAAPQEFNGLRADFLASYEPTPGTVAFFGYGSSMATSAAFGFSSLQRTNDGFFVKLAYQIRR
jgi:hypothetical protein